MWIEQLLDLDLDTVRFVLFASVAAGVIVYLKFRISEGGTLTAGYLVILGLSGKFGVIAMTLVSALIAYLVARALLTRFFGLTKPWLFVSTVVVGSLANSVFQLALNETGPLDLPWGLSLILYAGSFIIPGLIAYDVARQGLRNTALGLSLTSGIALAIVIPVLVLADWLQPESTTPYISTTGEIPKDLFWLGSLATVFLSGAVRLSFGLRTGGFIAPLFIVEVFSLSALVTIFAAAIAAHLIASWLRDRIVWSPRLRFQFTVMIGAMAAWTGLYWGSALGWEPALAANSFALEPLLAVALVASDMGRSDSSIARTILGSLATVAFIFAVLGLVAIGGAMGIALCAVFLVGLPAMLLIPGAATLRRDWARAVEAGREVAARRAGKMSLASPESSWSAR
ncbi:MAG: poly-gamma-glutamate biosynthesis protein PgsC/CapC [Solirubrobacterales bacterium]|jgi:hypothetical protein